DKGFPGGLVGCTYVGGGVGIGAGVGVVACCGGGQPNCGSGAIGNGDEPPGWAANCICSRWTSSGVTSGGALGNSTDIAMAINPSTITTITWISTASVNPDMIELTIPSTSVSTMWPLPLILFWATCPNDAAERNGTGISVISPLRIRPQPSQRNSPFGDRIVMMIINEKSAIGMRNSSTTSRLSSHRKPRKRVISYAVMPSEPLCAAAS